MHKCREKKNQRQREMERSGVTGKGADKRGAEGKEGWENIPIFLSFVMLEITCNSVIHC